MYYVKKTLFDETEILPDITETAIWNDYDDLKCPISVKNVAILYKAIVDRENYYQFNAPTAFGDARYSYLCGIVTGILLASNITEDSEDGTLKFRRGKKLVLVVDKVKRSEWYIEACKENKEVLKELGI